MIEILDHNLSPIVDYLDMGDIYAETGVPLVLHNPLAEPTLGVSGAIHQIETSDGYERLRFYKAEIPYFCAAPAFYTPDQLTVTGGAVAPGDIFDLHISVEGWLPMQVFRCAIPITVMVVSGVIQAYGALVVRHNLPLARITSAIYLKRRSDAQWFLVDAQLAKTQLPVWLLSAVADPMLDWSQQTMHGYSSETTMAPLPSNAAWISAGGYEPVLGAIRITGGGAAQNIFAFNPRRAGITATGGIIND